MSFFMHRTQPFPQPQICHESVLFPSDISSAVSSPLLPAIAIPPICFDVWFQNKPRKKRPTSEDVKSHQFAHRHKAVIFRAEFTRLSSSIIVLSLSSEPSLSLTALKIGQKIGLSLKSLSLTRLLDLDLLSHTHPK